MTTLLIILSAILTIASAVPYIVEIIRGKTKPRIVSWLTWSILTAIACVASFADGQYPGGILLAFATLETALIVILGWRLGDRKLERFDIVCMIGALFGMVLWLIFNSPAVAIVATIAIDLIGAIPTVRHSWQKPHEETWVAFTLAGAGGLLTVFAAANWKITAIAYPLYIAVINVLLTIIILVRHKHTVQGEPSELRKL